MKRIRLSKLPRTGVVAVVVAVSFTAIARPQEAGTQTPGDRATAESETPAVEPFRPQPPIDSKWKKLSFKSPIWLDKENHTVVVGGEICHREGPLEMFACPRNTKEHESVVVVDCKAFMVHAALLAAGVEPGKPVQFSPEYEPASGPIVDVFVEWLGKDGKKERRRGQDWVRHLPTGKAMPHDWVFAGSGFWVDEESGERFYLAEGGELICVSNFSTATLDVTVRSSDANASLMFGAFTEHIPPLGTRVHLLLTPRMKPKTTKADEDASGQIRKATEDASDK